MSEQTNLNFTANQINTILDTAVTDCTFTRNIEDISVTFRTNNGTFNRRISAAGANRAGIMTKDMFNDLSLLKTNYTNIVARLDAMPDIVTSVTFGEDRNGNCLLNLKSNGTTVQSEMIPNANEFSSGMLTKSDYKRIVNSVTLLEAKLVTNVPKSAIEYPVIVARPIGELVIDTYDGVLCLYLPVTRKYTTVWNNEQEQKYHLSSNDIYAISSNILIKGGSRLFSYNGTKWEAQSDGTETADLSVPTYTIRNNELFVTSHELQETDTPVLFRYLRGRYGKRVSTALGSPTKRLRYSGWVKSDLLLGLEDWNGKWHVGDYYGETWQYICQNELNLEKKCAIVFYRNGKPISGRIKFKFIRDEQNKLRMARW